MGKPTKIAFGDYDIPVDPSITIEGTPLSAVADNHWEPADDDILSYDDMLIGFAVTEDIYTKEQHDRLMFNILLGQLLGGKKDFNLKDSLPGDIANRQLLDASDISPYFVCELKKNELFVEEPSFGLAVGRKTAINQREVASGMYDHVMHSYLRDGCIEHVKGYSRIGGSFYTNRKAEELFGDDKSARTANLLWTLFHDPYKERAEWLGRSLETMGCSTIERDRECLEEADSYGEIEFTDNCPDLKRDIDCYTRAIATSYPPFDENNGGNSKDNITTNFDRALALQQYLEEIKNWLPQKVATIMDVGTGLEITSNEFCFGSGPAIYEPFAILNALAGIGKMDISNVQVDVVDINPLVIEHLDSDQFLAKTFYLPVTFNLAVRRDYYKIIKLDDPYVPFGENLPGTLRNRLESKSELEVREEVFIAPPVVEKLNPVLGDITADRIADDESYDLVVMFNVWQYLHPDEKWLALANITRLLRHGGVFLTDTQFEPTDDCLASGNFGLKKMRPSWVTFWMKE